MVMYKHDIAPLVKKKIYSVETMIISHNPYGMHRLIWDLFPDQNKRNFLYREEIAREQLGATKGARGEPVYYIVSSNLPLTN